MHTIYYTRSHTYAHTRSLIYMYNVDVQLNSSLSTKGSRCMRNQKRLLILFFIRSSPLRRSCGTLRLTQVGGAKRKLLGASSVASFVSTN